MNGTWILSLTLPTNCLSSAVRTSISTAAWDESSSQEYNRINKKEPMERALKQLNASTWFSGLRRSQAKTRANIAPIELKKGRFKVHPIFDWTDRDVGMYLKQHSLIIRCGRKAICPLATGTQHAHFRKLTARKSSASSDSSANAACMNDDRRAWRAHFRTAFAD